MDNFQKTGQKIKEELQQEKAVEEKNKEVAKSSLDLMRQNESLVRKMQENVEVGSENLSGSLPYLKIQSRKSTTNFLSDGTLPKDGNYFYTMTQEEFDSIDVHILAISRGFYVPTIQEDGSMKEKFNQLLSGVIINKGEEKPFIMYLSGNKLSPTWDLGKDHAPYKRKGIPLFALTVQMTTQEKKLDNNRGITYLPVYTILKDKEGNPIVISNEEEFDYYLEKSKDMARTLESIITKTINTAGGVKENEPNGVPIQAYDDGYEQEEREPEPF